MNWCVVIEIEGEELRVVGLFKEQARAETVIWHIHNELRRREIPNGIRCSVQVVVPKDNWESVLPWNVEAS